MLPMRRTRQLTRRTPFIALLALLVALSGMATAGVSHHEVAAGDDPSPTEHTATDPMAHGQHGGHVESAQPDENDDCCENDRCSGACDDCEGFTTLALPSSTNLILGPALPSRPAAAGLSLASTFQVPFLPPI